RVGCAAEGRRPATERMAVESLAALAGREPAAGRKARCEQLARRRQRGLGDLAEARNATGRADVLRQLQILVLQVAAGPDDRLAGAVRELERGSEAEAGATDRHDDRALLVPGVPDQDRVARRETGTVDRRRRHA